jgi:hypothetical protein
MRTVTVDGSATVDEVELKKYFNFLSFLSIDQFILSIYSLHFFLLLNTRLGERRITLCIIFNLRIVFRSNMQKAEKISTPGLEQLK